MPLALNLAVQTWCIFRIFIKLKFDWISLLNELFIDIFVMINIIDHSSLLFLQPNGPQRERGSQEQKMFSTFFWGFHQNCTAMLWFGFQEKYFNWKLKLLGSLLISVGSVRSCYSYQSFGDNRLQVSPLIEWSSIGFFFLLPVGWGSGLSIILNKFWIYEEEGAVIDRADESLDLLRTKKIRISISR